MMVTNIVKMAVAVALTFVLFGADRAEGAFIMSIYDDGTDLTMTATGTYDLSSIAPTPDGDPGFSNAGINSSGWMGWGVGTATDRYAVLYSGLLTLTGNAGPATSATTTSPFVIFPSNNGFFLPSGASPIGTVNETAVFTGVTLASLGMIAGETVNVTWQGDSAIIQTIPEPASIGLLGLVSGSIYFTRRFFIA